MSYAIFNAPPTTKLDKGECKLLGVDTVGFYREWTTPLPDWRRTVK